MMRRKNNKERLAIQIGITLTAGMFSIVPTAFGAPTGGQVAAGGANIDNPLNITSTTKNNVITWQDFSVGKNETVRFDGGAKTNNYLNIVTGANTSNIQGKIQGGNDVYLVNPNGIIIGKDAVVDVGNFYASTRYVSEEAAKQAAGSQNLAAVLSDTSKSVAADVVNLGTVQADQVVVEGQNIRFLDSSKVNSSSVTLRANGYIHVGNTTGSDAGYTGKTLSGAENQPVYYQLIDSMNQVTSSGNYMLTQNLTDGSSFNGTFSGNFDGMGYTVSGITNDYGLFRSLNNARIDNVGVVNSTITTSQDKPIGALASTAYKTVVNNTYNDGTTVSGGDALYVGGLIGQADNNVKISNSFNHNAGTLNGGAFIGFVNSGSSNEIVNSYSIGSVSSAGGIVSGAMPNTAGITIRNCFSAVRAGDGKGITTDNVLILSNTLTGKHLSDFSSWGNDISNTGGVKIDADGNVTRPTWRIYEGQSTPVLTSMLKGVATVDYDYTHGTESGSNDGKDLSVVYNAKDVVLDHVAIGSNVDISTVEKGVKLHNANTDSDTSVGVAYYYDGQDGFDLVGGNVAIRQRQVNVTNTFTDKTMSKQYDGTTKVTKEAVASLFAGSSSDGLIPGDNTASLDTTGLTASYDKKDVGAERTVTIKGGLSLNAPKQADTGYANYKLSQTSLTIGSDTNPATVKGIITQRDLHVGLKDSNGVDKEYDGNAAIKDAMNADLFQLTESDLVTDGTTGKQEKVSLGLTGNAAGTYVDRSSAGDQENKNAGKHSVRYTGLILSGGDAANYRLVDADGNPIYALAVAGLTGGINTTSGGTMYTAGEITPKELASTGFSWYLDGQKQEAKREYSASSSYTEPTGHIVRSDNMAQDSLTFTADSAAFIKASDGSTKEKTANVADAKGVLYTVRISGSDASNYQIGGTTLVDGGTVDVIGEGAITPRTVWLKATDKVLSKAYDGTDAALVNGKDTFSLSDGYVSYAKDAAHQLIDGDNNQIVLSGKYLATNGEGAQEVNNLSGALQNKKVSYTAKVTDASGADSANYTLVWAANPSTEGTKITFESANGLITPRALKGIAFGDVSKTYDASDAVKGEQITDRITVAGLDGLAAGDDVGEVVNAAALKGRYGLRNGADFSYSADVCRDTSNQVAKKDVEYTGVRSAFTGAKAHNYTFDGADKQYGKGTINPLLIDRADQLTLDRKTGTSITKVYDGTQKVAHDTVAADSYVDKLYATVGATKVYFDYRVDSADYATKNSKGQAAQDVTYKLNLDRGNGNYEIADSALTDGKLVKTFDSAGVITPRTLTALLRSDNLTKTYDATTNVTDEAGTVLTGDQLVTLTGLVAGDGTKNASTAAYVSKDAGSGDQLVRYTLQIAGDGTADFDPTNYVFSENPVYGGGTINKRDITIAFDPLKKIYDGDALVQQDDKSADGPSIIRAAIGDGTAGNQVLGRDGISTALDSSPFYRVSEYGKWDGDAFKADDNVTEVHAVRYTGVSSALKNRFGDLAKNYNLDAVSDTQYGEGTITPLSIKADQFKFTVDSVTKEYDNGYDASKAHAVIHHYVDMSAAGLPNLDYDYTITSASYAQSTGKDAGKGKQVTYKVEVKPEALANFKIDGTVPELTSTTTNGEITRRTVYAAAVSPEWVKTYDGTTELRTGNPSWSGDTATGTKKTGDGVIQLTGRDGGDWMAKDDGAQNISTGQYRDANAGTGKTVDYTVAIDAAHAKNYAIYNLADKDKADRQEIDSLSTANNTINKYGLALSFNPVNDPVNRDYDGTTNIDHGLVHPHLAPAWGTDSVSLDNGYTANYIDPNVKTVNASASSSVIYDGLKLTGGDADNYMLVDTKGAALAVSAGDSTARTMTGAGTMNKFKLTGDNVTFSFGKVGKVYDATTTVSYNGDTSSEALRGFLNDHYVTLNGTNKQDIVVDMKSAEYDTRDHGENKTVTFMMYLNGDNYDYSDLEAHGVVDREGNFKAQTTTGSIARRKVYASLTDDPADVDIVKTYDGRTNVAQDVAGKVTLREGDLCTEKDGVTLAAPDAQYTDPNAGTDKDVRYTVSLSGDTAGNYEIHDLSNLGKADSEDGEISSLIGKGTINKAVLSIDFARREKDYDTRDAVQDIAPTLTGVNNEVLAFDGNALSKIHGRYGTWDPATDQFVADANVSRDANGNVQDKGVYYEGLQDALQSMVDGGSIVACNYTIADTVYFDEAKGKGRIRPLAVTQGAVAHWTPVAKEYDADTSLPVGADKVLRLTVNGQYETSPIELSYTVNAAAYDNKDAGDSHKLNVTLKSLNKNLGNYQLSDAYASELLGRTWESESNNIITPRKVNAWLEKTQDITKTYDGTVNADASNVRIDDTSASILAKDGLAVGVRAEYDGKDAAASEADDTLLSHSVTYTLTLDNPNYKLERPELRGSGTIRRQALDIVAEPITVRAGEPLPVFGGQVNGLASGEEDLAGSFAFRTMPEVTTSAPGVYAVYGWYQDRTAGNFGQNYTFSQNPANEEAFTVSLIDPGREYHDTVNPKTQFRPDDTSYRQSSLDHRNHFDGRPDAALEYRDGQGRVMGTEPIGVTGVYGPDSGETRSQTIGRIGISRGSVINLEHADVANAASVRVENQGQVVNLEILPVTPAAHEREASAEIRSTV
ncbi:YDG domain-containing protein [Selenomonas montiformis]|uniref:YDG domain-containing protein n=1 Tax=Selenomonas montiformis TaxID=2652285 RepID=UPI003F8C4D76